MAKLVRGRDRQRVQRLRRVIERILRRDDKVTAANVWADFRTWLIANDLVDVDLSAAFTQVQMRCDSLLTATV